METKEETKTEEQQEKPPMVTDLDEGLVENEGVISDKTSDDRLIIKSPDNLSVSAKSSVKEVKCVEKSVVFDGDVFWLGGFQVIFGVFMMGFGVYAILHDASMALTMAGIWSGLIAISTGIFGILATAKKLCPIEEKWRKISQNLFLALSLVSLALSQLVVVLAGIGLARDLNNTENEEENPNFEAPPTSTSKFSIIIPENYLGILANASLILFSSLECMCALISSYKGAKALCPCFKKEDILYTGLPMNNSHALVSSWLGKHNPPPQIYVVTSGSTKGKKMSGGLPIAPIFYQPQIVGLPLIPAPLGTIPSPIIPPNKKPPHMYNKHLKMKRPIEKTPRPSRSRSRSRSRTETSLTEKEVVKTYTGLDKEIAEQFIEKCEKQKGNSDSLSSKTSLDNSSSPESTTNSKDFLVKN